MQVSVHNRGPDDAEVHLLPTLWFRHTWSWAGGTDQPSLRRLDESAEFRLAETGRSQLAVGGPGAGRFLRPGRNRDQTGLFVDLGAWQFHLLAIRPSSGLA